MFIIQIRRVERKEDNIVLVYLKKEEGRKNFLNQNQKYSIGNKNILGDSYSRTA